MNELVNFTVKEDKAKKTGGCLYGVLLKQMSHAW